MVSLDTVTCISGRSNEKLMTVAAPGGISIVGGVDIGGQEEKGDNFSLCFF